MNMMKMKRCWATKKMISLSDALTALDLLEVLINSLPGFGQFLLSYYNLGPNEASGAELFDGDDEMAYQSRCGMRIVIENNEVISVEAVSKALTAFQNQ